MAARYYHFDYKEFIKDGFHQRTEKWFMDLIGEFERDFHTAKHPIFANYLFGNIQCMKIIHRAMDFDDSFSVGMELINGRVDIDANMEIDNKSEKSLVYAVDSKLDENPDDPLFLVCNDDLENGLLILEYKGDDDDGEHQEIPVMTPISNKQRVRG